MGGQTFKIWIISWEPGLISQMPWTLRRDFLRISFIAPSWRALLFVNKLAWNSSSSSLKTKFATLPEWFSTVLKYILRRFSLTSITIRLEIVTNGGFVSRVNLHFWIYVDVLFGGICLVLHVHRIESPDDFWLKPFGFAARRHS